MRTGLSHDALNNKPYLLQGLSQFFGVAAVGKGGGRILFPAYCLNETKIMPLEKISGLRNINSGQKRFEFYHIFSTFNALNTNKHSITTHFRYIFYLC
jgi:hypothetical protein